MLVVQISIIGKLFCLFPLVHARFLLDLPPTADFPLGILKVHQHPPIQLHLGMLNKLQQGGKYGKFSSMSTTVLMVARVQPPVNTGCILFRHICSGPWVRSFLSEALD